MAGKWDKLLDEAEKLTNKQLQKRISSLTSLSDDKIAKIIKETGISKTDIVEVLRIVSDARIKNNDKAQAIKKINGGLETLLKVSSYFI